MIGIIPDKQKIEIEKIGDLYRLKITEWLEQKEPIENAFKVLESVKHSLTAQVRITNIKKGKQKNLHFWTYTLEDISKEMVADAIVGEYMGWTRIGEMKIRDMFLNSSIIS